MPINVRTSAFLCVAAVGSLLGLLYLGASVKAAPASETSTINATLCAGGNRTPSGAITSPQPGAIVSEHKQRLVITTSWVRSYSIYVNATKVQEVTTLPYGANVTTSAEVELPDGVSTLYVTLHGGCPEQSVTTPSITLTFSSAATTVTPAITNNRSPRLRGTVTHTHATVTITINSRTYTARNNGDGTWTLPAGTIRPGLPDGRYAVRVIALLHNTPISDTLLQNAVTVHTTPPHVTLESTQSSQRSPELSGTINDPFATITITINNRTYTARNNGDGTWTLPAGVVAPLASGTYQARIEAIDQAGNRTVTHQSIAIHAADELGFLLSPNTGYLRVATTNIPSPVLYLVMLFCLVSLLHAARRNQNTTQQPPQH